MWNDGVRLKQEALRAWWDDPTWWSGFFDPPVYSAGPFTFFLSTKPIWPLLSFISIVVPNNCQALSLMTAPCLTELELDESEIRLSSQYQPTSRMDSEHDQDRPFSDQILMHSNEARVPSEQYT